MSKTILITGTSSGFGKLTTITLANEGHSVIAGMRDVNGRNAAVAKELAALPNVEVVELDVANDQSVTNAVQQVIKKYGTIDVLVNNAGVAGFGLLEATSLEQIKKIFEVNLFGVVRTYQAVLPSMRANKKGLIINISSGLGLFATPFIIPYEMTKFGLEALTEGIRHEVKEYGIESVSVLPGPFPTEVGNKASAYGPDRADILASYGPGAQQSFEQFGGAMYSKMTDYKMEAQEVADAVLVLVNQKAGTRPYNTVVNRIGEGAEQAHIDNKLVFKKAIMENMGWGSF